MKHNVDYAAILTVTVISTRPKVLKCKPFVPLRHHISIDVVAVYSLSLFKLIKSVAQTLACSLVNCQLNYCNSLLYGAPERTVNKLERTQNNAARVALAVNHRSDAKPLLQRPHGRLFVNVF